VSPHGARVWLSANGKAASAPRARGSDPAHRQGSPAPGVPTWGASLAHAQGKPASAPAPGARVPEPAALLKLELIILSPTIFSMPNASQQKR